MRITRIDASILEMRGRQEDKEQGTGGLWLLFIVALAFLAVSTFWLWDETIYRGTSLPSFASKSSIVMASTLGVAGAVLLVFGIVLALNRESLILDLNARTGVYRRWRLPRGRSTTLRFGLDQIAGVDVHQRIETISDGDGPSTRHRKWEARLHVVPNTVLPLCRSSNPASANQLADRVRRFLGLKQPDKKTE